MSNNDTKRPLRRKFQFSLLALLALTTVVSIVLAWWTQSTPTGVIAILAFDSRPQTIGTCHTNYSAEDHVKFCDAHVAMMIGHDNLAKTLRSPAVAKLELVKTRFTSVAQLQKALGYEFFNEYSILALSLRADPQHLDDAAILLDTIVATHLRMHVEKEMTVDLKQLRKLHADYTEAQQRLAEKQQQAAMRRSQQNLTLASTELETEISILKNRSDDLMIELETIGLLNNGVDRIHPVGLSSTTRDTRTTAGWRAWTWLRLN